jgi:SWI2/SNF2 ATPase
MAMIHKFQERDLTETFPELNPNTNILIMTDEAHRSQYSLLGANLDKALPKATRIGYTGTPIDKTETVFGDYIDKYTMRQSIEDKVTLEIVYEGRTHNAEVTDRVAMDTAFEDVFSDYNLQERMQILGYGSRDAYLEAESTIAAKAKDMVAHYVQQIFTNGYKAQVVATSREAAVRYKKHLDTAILAQIAQLETANPHGINLDRLKRVKTDVVISGGHNDLPHLKLYSNSVNHETVIKSFKLPFDRSDNGVTGDIGIVIVNNMLLTGFDAPVEQVLYLDKTIQAHNLLQAIARVNRIPEKLLQLTDTYLQSQGIDQKVKPISILDENFERDVVATKQRTKNKAAAIEHALRHHIDIELDDDPDLQASFAAALAVILSEFQDNWDRIYLELEKLRQRLKDTEKEPTYGLHKKKQMPFFRMFKRECFGDADLDDDTISLSVALTQEVFIVVERELKLAGFWESIPARKKLEADIQTVLLSPSFNTIADLFAKRKQMIGKVMEIAEKNHDRILYAE